MLKELLGIIPAVGAILVVLIKFSNSFFKTYVKTKFRDVPGEDDVVAIIAKGLLFFIVIIDLLFIAVITYGIFYGKLDSMNILNAEISDFIAMSIVILTIFILPIGTCINVYCLSRLYIKSMYSKVTIKRWIVNLNYGFIVASILLWVPILKEEIMGNIFVGTVWQVMNIAVILYYISIMLICINLNKEIKHMKSQERVVINLANESIVCYGYIEFSKVFLILSEKQQRYIMKSEVKSILKEKI